jgi:hypothetical protein
MRESHRIRQENTGNRWNMEAIFRSEMVRIFPVDSSQLFMFSNRNWQKIIGKNPAGMLLPCPAISGVILPEPARTS